MKIRIAFLRKKLIVRLIHKINKITEERDYYRNKAERITNV